jgi:quercetin dioxygenase-like cupin family protein
MPTHRPVRTSADSGAVAPRSLIAETVCLAPNQGEAFQIIGGGVRILIDGAASGGRCCMFECPVGPGEGPPLHSHQREGEYFYVLAGRFKFSIDGRVLVGERGTFACAPRSTIHSFRNVGKTPGLLHVSCTPAGLETPFRAVRIPSPGEGRTPPTPDQVEAEFARHGVTFHGPPLDAE